jgi:hypothetical protein
MKAIADQMRGNGYMPLPLTPGDKSIKIERWSLLAAREEYDQIWKNAADNVNIGIYTGQSVIILDFDAKGNAPSIEVYRWLLDHHPEVFAGAIIEQTPSGGIHATFRWSSCAISLPMGKGKTYARFVIDGTTYDVELLTRGSQAVCPPSRTEKGEYRYLTERTHLNTRRDELPELPDLFRDANSRYLEDVLLSTRARAPMPTRRQGNFTDAELQLAVDALPAIYLKNAREGHRHFQALGLACNVAGISGMGRRDVERAVEDFFRGCNREPNSPNEIQGIVTFGANHPDSNPFIPSMVIYKKRKLELLNAARQIGKGER